MGNPRSHGPSVVQVRAELQKLSETLGLHPFHAVLVDVIWRAAVLCRDSWLGLGRGFWRGFGRGFGRTPCPGRLLGDGLGCWLDLGLLHLRFFGRILRGRCSGHWVRLHRRFRGRSWRGRLARRGRYIHDEVWLRVAIDEYEKARPEKRSRARRQFRSELRRSRSSCWKPCRIRSSPRSRWTGLVTTWAGGTTAGELSCEFLT